MELSQKLKELRKKQGLTQLELAERLFVSRQAISGAVCVQAGHIWMGSRNVEAIDRESAEPEQVI